MLVILRTGPPRLLALVVAGAALALASAPLEGQSDPGSLEALVDSIAREHLDAGRLAGMSVGVTHGPDTLLLEAYGRADLEWDVPMPLDAIHEIGSVTKQFTSVAMLQLWADGKVDLDADLTEYLPDFDTQGRAIPLRRLFDHTSGIKGYTEMPSFGELRTRALPRDSLVAMVEAEPLEFEPGYALIYNNSAYFLLGLIIEEASGQSYGDYLEEHVFPRAGMDDTSYCTNDEVWERRAHGYQTGPGGLRRADYIDHTWPYSAGSLCSTVGDLIAWNRALHGGEVLGREAYDLLITPQALEDGTPVRYAMGLSHYRIPSGRVIEHGGGIPGFVSHSRYYPDEDAIVVVLQNSAGPPGPAGVANAIGEHLFGADDVPDAGTYAGDLATFAGMYRGPARGSTMTARITVVDGSLRLAGAGPARTLEFLEGTTFFAGNARYRFDVEAGVARALHADQVGGHYVLERVDEEAEAASHADLPAAVLARYVGTYEFGPGRQIEVTLEDGQLFAQATGQGRFPIFADSETEFHLDLVEASLEFVVNADGRTEAMIFQQNGVSQRGERLPD